MAVCFLHGRVYKVFFPPKNDSAKSSKVIRQLDAVFLSSSFFIVYHVCV